MTRHVWSDASEKFLRDNYSTKSAEEIATYLKVSTSSVHNKAFKLKLKGRINGSWNLGLIKALTKEEIEFVKKFYSTHGSKYCSDKLGKSRETIRYVTNKLGLKVDRKSLVNNDEELKKHLQNHHKQFLYPNILSSKKLLDEEEIKKLYRNGKTLKQVADICGCSTQPIVKILKHEEKRLPSDYPTSKCRNQFGENNPSWKGGIKSVYDRIRGLKEYNNWRGSIFHRDGEKCRICGDSEDIQAHHIKYLRLLVSEYCTAVKKLPKDLNEEDLKSQFFYDIDNGITLCKICHTLEHKINGK